MSASANGLCTPTATATGGRSPQPAGSDNADGCGDGDAKEDKSFEYDPFIALFYRVYKRTGMEIITTQFLWYMIHF